MKLEYIQLQTGNPGGELIYRRGDTGGLSLVQIEACYLIVGYPLFHSAVIVLVGDLEIVLLSGANGRIVLVNRRCLSRRNTCRKDREIRE